MTSPYYSPSVLLVPVLALACVTGMLSAIVAAWLGVYVPSALKAFVLNLIVTGGFTLWLSVIAYRVCKLGKVRNPVWMGRIGLGIGCLGWYSHCTAWAILSSHRVSSRADLQSLAEIFVLGLVQPDELIRYAWLVLQYGAPGLDGWRPGGGWLLALWLIEMCLYLVSPWLVGRSAARDLFCEKTRTWVDKSVLPYRFFPVDEVDEVRRQLEHAPQRMPTVLESGCAGCNHAQITLHRCQGGEVYVSIHNVSSPRQDKTGKSLRYVPVIEGLRLPVLDIDALVRRLGEASVTDPFTPAYEEGPECRTLPELEVATDHLDDEEYQAALRAAGSHMQATRRDLRIAANRVCALACARLGRWADACSFRQAMYDDERSAYNASRLANSWVMAGDLSRAVTWLGKAKAINATAKEVAPILLLTAFVDALREAGETTTAMRYLDDIRQGYIDLGTTDPAQLFAAGVPFLSTFLEKSAPIVRASLGLTRQRSWYEPLVARLDDGGRREVAAWLAR